MNLKPKYRLRTTVGATAYAFGTWAMIYLSSEHSHSPYRYWLMLLPVIPMLYLIIIDRRKALEENDELGRKILTEAKAFTADATAWTCCSFFLLRFMGVPTMHAEWVFFMMVAYCLIGLFLSRRRYQ